MEKKCRVNKSRIEKAEDSIIIEPGPRPRITVKGLDGSISPGPDYPGPYEPDILITPAEGIEARIEEGKMAESLKGKTEAELKAMLDDLRRKVSEAEGNGKK